MRKIGPAPIITFFSLASLSLILGIFSTLSLLGGLPLGDFRGVVLILAGVFFSYLYAIIIYRGFIYFVPLTEGDIEEGGREEFAAQVHFLFYLMLFNSLIRSHLFPAPLMRLTYQLLGARLGQNSFCVGVILDPALTYIGKNSIVGHDAALFSHVIEGKRLSLHAIRIGDNVTIGAKAVLMPGVTIGDGATVSVGAVVPKGTTIIAGDTWAGIPARLISRSQSVELESTEASSPGRHP